MSRVTLFLCVGRSHVVIIIVRTPPVKLHRIQGIEFGLRHGTTPFGVALRKRSSTQTLMLAPLVDRALFVVQVTVFRFKVYKLLQTRLETWITVSTQVETGR